MTSAYNTIIPECVSPSMEQVDSWDEFYRTNRRAWRGVTDISDMGIEPGSDVLEVGCGNGKTLAALKGIGCNVIGVDFSEEAVISCRQLIPDVEVRHGDILDLEFEDCSFDAVVLFHVLEHVLPEDMGKVASEIGRVLRPGGRAYIRSFSVDDMRSEKGERISEDMVIRGNGIRYRYYSESSLRDSFPEGVFETLRRVYEPTRFGTIRSRIEAIVRF